MLLNTIYISLLIIIVYVSADDQKNVYRQISDKLLETPITFYESYGEYYEPMFTNNDKKEPSTHNTHTTHTQDTNTHKIYYDMIRVHDIKHTRNAFDIILDINKDFMYKCILDLYSKDIIFLINKNIINMKNIEDHFTETKYNKTG
eukprot:GHVR01091409.1.p1 GENE.GHVR01091409.1~~GHVR01091409.1.p1  ORF type:complete len:146 (+),score=51.69 GHVR01091409.1:16-453(+)